jgi:hypothetical protein
LTALRGAFKKVSDTDHQKRVALIATLIGAGKAQASNLTLEEGDDNPTVVFSHEFTRAMSIDPEGDDGQVSILWPEQYRVLAGPYVEIKVTDEHLILVDKSTRGNLPMEYCFPAEEGVLQVLSNANELEIGYFDGSDKHVIVQTFVFDS